MALSEVRKRKIKEEEKYRARIKKGFEKPKKKGIGCGGIILLLAFVFIGIPLILSSDNSFNQTKRTRKEASQTQGNLQVQKIDENTSFASKKENDKTVYAVYFEEPLQRDDYIVGKEIGRVIAHIYSAGTVSDPTPKFVERNGVNLISLDASDGNSFLVLLMKNDNGTVHSMSIWKE